MKKVRKSLMFYAFPKRSQTFFQNTEVSDAYGDWPDAMQGTVLQFRNDTKTADVWRRFVVNSGDEPLKPNQRVFWLRGFRGKRVTGVADKGCLYAGRVDKTLLGEVRPGDLCWITANPSSRERQKEYARREAVRKSDPFIHGIFRRKRRRCHAKPI